MFFLFSPSSFLLPLPQDHKRHFSCRYTHARQSSSWGRGKKTDEMNVFEVYNE